MNEQIHHWDTITVNGEEFKRHRLEIGTVNKEPSMTQQQFKDEVDINNIIAKYQNGEHVDFARRQGVYADVSEITDYHESINKIKRADQAFSALPAHVRNRFGNDPEQLLEFLQDPHNYDEGVKLGIYEPKKPKQEPQIQTSEATNVNQAPKTKTKNAPDPKTKLDEE